MRILLILLTIMSMIPSCAPSPVGQASSLTVGEASSPPPVLGVDPAAGKQVEQTLKLDRDKSVAYLLYLPNEYDSKEGKWPLLLFLHGRGESRGPLSAVKKWGPPRLIERGESFPYVVVSPQCPEAETWDQSRQEELLLELLDHLAKQFKIDPDRIYLTGLSMGGYGAWRLAADHLKGLPIWVFHGTDDPAVPLQRSVEMVEAIKKAGSTTIRFTTLEWIGHNSWEAAYASPDLYQWLDKQTASKNRAKARD